MFGLLLFEDSTTSSDSKLTGSPIVVSFASLDSEGLSPYWFSFADLGFG